ncbi:endonuclease-reverse transcriptase domain-containing protein [Phthorimaea operculella]|nr:endonuclease-reverse transcriptase domain-containing protein [Phthorimaea operculella]
MNIVHWNARSLNKIENGKRILLGKLPFLKAMLYFHNVHVALISETKLKSTTTLSIPGYKVYRKDEISNKKRATAFRGLLVVVREDIDHSPIEYKAFESNCFYALGVDVHLEGAGNIRVYAAYRPPGGNSETLQLFTSAVRELLDARCPVILAGDFNAKHPHWNSTKVCRYGECLYHDAYEVTRGYNVTGPAEHTHRNDRTGETDTIDLIVSRGLQVDPPQTVLSSGLLSDHSPVLFTIPHEPSMFMNLSVTASGCSAPCSTFLTCTNCTAEECIWCASNGRCVDKNAYGASFPLGGCRAWSTSGSNGVSACGAAPGCAQHVSCSDCRTEPACGWCDDGLGGGRGVCVAGGERGPHNPLACTAQRWHFTKCPLCQCNGHSVCDSSSRCIQPCGGRAIGEHCDSCAPGHWGSPLNGKHCLPCECNAQATACAPDTGRCYCSTKGLAGDRCDKCDNTNHYHADAYNKGACYSLRGWQGIASTSVTTPTTTTQTRTTRGRVIVSIESRYCSTKAGRDRFDKCDNTNHYHADAYNKGLLLRVQQGGVIVSIESRYCSTKGLAGDRCDKCDNTNHYHADAYNKGRVITRTTRGRVIVSIESRYCSTKGLAGDRCDKCDNTNHYHADAYNKGACYYDLAVDYQFTFNLSKKEDRHLSAINFRNAPVKPDVDADFSITCSAHARMNLTVRTRADPHERVLFQHLNCTNFRHKFAKSEHAFGVEDNVTLTTFFVYVYDFRPPLWIQISFSQYPKLNLQQFFITFSSCFLLLLLVAAALWKIKQISFSQYPKLNLQQFFITFSSCFLLLLLVAAALWKIKQCMTSVVLDTDLVLTVPQAQSAAVLHHLLIMLPAVAVSSSSTVEDQAGNLSFWIQISFSQYPKLNLQQFFITFSSCFLLLLLVAAALWKIKQISFSQYPKLNLQQFFITFSSCFLLLLLVAAALWKIKQKYDMYRRRQRLFVEMEQMASRPFSQVCVELEKGGGGTGVPAPVALEPCRGGRAAVLSLLVRLPTGGTGRAPPLGGLAAASALVTLGQHHAPNSKQ